MQLILYTTKDASNVIGKTLTQVADLNISMKKTEDIEQPTIVLTDTGLTCNYAKIPFFNRYYFIDEFKRGTNGLITLVLSVDVLETYKDDILNAKASITSYYPDNTVTDVRKRKDVYNSDVTLPDDETMILVTTGSGGANK